MNDSLSLRRPPRKPIELQLTAMMDIFSMIVIFLVLGSVFGTSEMVIPAKMKVPQSFSKEGVESAPRVVIESKTVTTSITNDPVSLTHFRPKEGSPASNPAIELLKARLQTYIQSLPKQNQSPAILLNVIADRDAPYRDIFDVVTVFRGAGFNTLLFVAQGEAGTKIDINPGGSK
jgi:biopolymer transport protein ExbD